MLTSPRNRIQCGSAGDSQTEKIFQKRLWKISACDFQNQILQLPARKRQGNVASNLESFQIFKNYAKIRREIIKNHANF
jgi:hypothetical protein